MYAIYPLWLAIVEDVRTFWMVGKETHETYAEKLLTFMGRLSQAIMVAA